jgi:hypothetical protein
MSKARGASAARRRGRRADFFKVRPSNVGKGKRFNRMQVISEWDELHHKPIISKVIYHFNDQHY